MTLLAMAQNSALVCFAVTIIFMLHRLYTTFTDPLFQIPGPIAARVTRLWLLYKVYTGSLPQGLIDLHRRHGKILCPAEAQLQPHDNVLDTDMFPRNKGPVVRIAPGQYSIDDPAAVAILYGAGKNFIEVSSTDRNSLVYPEADLGSH